VAVDRLAVDRLDQAVLRAEVVVERALRDAGVRGDLVEARAQAVGREARDRGVDELAAGLVGGCRASGGGDTHIPQGMSNGRLAQPLAGHRCL
jgi:hypothetical protein